MKKLIALFLAVVMILGVMPTVSFAARTQIRVNGENFVDKSSEGVYHISYHAGVLTGSPDDWVEYEIDIPEDGTYSISELVFSYISTANLTAASKLDMFFYLDGEKFGETGPTGMKGTSDYDQFWKCDVQFQATAGKHRIKIGKKNNVPYSLASFLIKEVAEIDANSAATTGPYKKVVLPAIIEGENFDLGATGSVSLDDFNYGVDYRTDSFLDIYDEEDGEKIYLQLQKGESVRYTFEVRQSNAYEMKIAARYPGNVEVYFDDNPYPVSAKLNSGASAFSDEEIITIYLPKGEHSIKLVSEAKLDIDSLKFTTAQGGQYVKIDQLEALAKLKEAGENAPHPVHKELYISPDGDDNNTGEKDSPFKTLTRVRDEIAKLNDDMEGDIIVNFSEGYHYVPEAIDFTNEHSGKNGYDIIFRGSDEGEKPIIGGGKQITGWEQTDKPEIWKADASHVEDTRSLYVNGYMARRAMSKYRYYPNDNYVEPNSEYESDGMKIKKGNFPKLQKPRDAEIIQTWLHIRQRAPMEDLIDGGDMWILKMDQPYWFWSTSSKDNFWMGHIHKETRSGCEQTCVNFFVIENDLSLLDQPGEFYFDKDEKVIYYYPYYEEDITTADTWVGTTEGLLKFNGNGASDKMTNYRFENISFRHASWNDLSRTGKTSKQADMYVNGPRQQSVISGAGITPGMLEFNWIDGVQFRDCEFTNMGGACVSMVDGVANAKFVGNSFHDIGGTGILISTWNNFPNNESKPVYEKPHDIEITNNLFRRVAVEIGNVTAIAVYFADNLKISHNYIADTPYSGTTMGWGFSVYPGTDIGLYNVEYSYNRIERTMQKLHDGGAAYFLGNYFGKGDVIGNYIDDAISLNGGIYFDGGSSFLTAKNNVVLNTAKWIKKNVWGGGCFAIDNYTNMPEALDTETARDPYHLMEESGTVYMTEDISNYPEAVAIRDNAGLTDEYKHLMNGTDLPEWMPEYWEWVPMAHFVGSNTWSNMSAYVDFFDGDASAPDIYEFKSFGYTNSVGDTTTGEWQEYDIEIYADGEYEVRMIGAQPGTMDVDTIIRLWCDGEHLIDGHVPCVVLNDYITTEFTAGKVYMTKGVHRIRVEQVNRNSLVGAFIFDDGTVHNYDDYNYMEGKMEPRVPNVEPVCPKEYMYRFTDKEAIERPGDPKQPTVFDDIQGHWAESVIKRMAKNGMVNGVGEKKFDPESKVTLYEAIWMAFRATRTEYTDANWKQIAVDHGLLTSVNEADIVLTRERFASIMMKMYIEARGGTYTLNVDPKAYKDMAEVDEKYAYDVYGTKEVGILGGFPDKTFRPKANLTRAEAAKGVSELYKWVNWE